MDFHFPSMTLKLKRKTRKWDTQKNWENEEYEGQILNRVTANMCGI